MDVRAESQWLLSRSMLAQAGRISRAFLGQGSMWQRAYGEARPRAASDVASVWFTAYPAAIATRKGENVLQALGRHDLWNAFASIGIHGIHIGPTKVAGGIRDRLHTPSIDGGFDRISFDIDSQYGSHDDFVALTKAAMAHDAVVIDDVIPGHTGKGADFRLAELGFEHYPGLYHMVEIREEDWGLLPDVAEGRDCVNLSPAAVESLREKRYIVGQLQRVIFYEPGVKETDWSATSAIAGVDGRVRRWVYLHYFKDGQPSLNWLDPSFAAQQLVIGDALHAISGLGAKILRLDANGFLGIEQRPSGKAWSESHPLSVVSNQIIAGMIRKVGGFSFQELNLTVDDIAAMSSGGADLSYDFITRPAYHHALLTGDTEFLRLMLRTVHDYKIDPASLIHALQNHDELTLELVHFWTKHANDTYDFAGESLPGSVLRDRVRSAMYAGLTGARAPYNLPFVTNGVACTTASVIAASLGIRDLASISADDVSLIRQIHLLLVMYNAFQPGVFAISGWDLVGALPLPSEAVEPLIVGGDTRWINRGSYDLVGDSPDAEDGAVPRATSLYGNVPDQLADPDSFASGIKKLLAIRHSYGLASSRQIAVPEVATRALLLMIHDLPQDRGTQITALNFGPSALVEDIELADLRSLPVVDMIQEEEAGVVGADGLFTLRLEAYEGRSLRVAKRGGLV